MLKNSYIKYNTLKKFQALSSDFIHNVSLIKKIRYPWDTVELQFIWHQNYIINDKWDMSHEMQRDVDLVKTNFRGNLTDIYDCEYSRSKQAKKQTNKFRGF
jgi:hypothetical protein